MPCIERLYVGCCDWYILRFKNLRNDLIALRLILFELDVKSCDNYFKSFQSLYSLCIFRV
jgi:hypothetical protein